MNHGYKFSKGEYYLSCIIVQHPLILWMNLMLIIVKLNEISQITINNMEIWRSKHLPNLKFSLINENVHLINEITS